ncbi:uncharacterized protein [Atheta coriaria]|uniref:uncharacterized protein n=1 Tax=Dalotia coriaria TaxID=877792 RepID=UPI0031F3C77D
MSIKIELCAIVLVVACATSTSAFFLSWGSPQPVKSQHPPPQQQQTQLPQPYPPTLAYYQRVVQHQPQYVDNNGVPMQPLQPIPSIPIQVPLQAQFSPAPGIHNVQLVPCLCPVSQDMEPIENAAFPSSQQQQAQQPQQQMQQLQQQQLQQIQQQIQQKQNP